MKNCVQSSQHTPSWVAQVKEMQGRLACAWRFWVWDEPEGLALEALICALRLKLLPAIVPRVDWQSCRLHCL